LVYVYSTIKMMHGPISITYFSLISSERPSQTTQCTVAFIPSLYRLHD